MYTDNLNKTFCFPHYQHYDMRFTTDIGINQVLASQTQIDAGFSYVYRKVGPNDLDAMMLYRSDRLIVACKGWCADLSRLTSALPLERSI